VATSGRGGAAAPKGSVYDQPPPSLQPEAKPLGPTGKVTSTPNFRGAQRGSMPAFRQTVTHLPKGPSQADLTFQSARNAIGPAALKQASNPRIAALQQILGDATGIPSAVNAARTHNAVALAGNAAMLFPFGRIGKAIKGGVDVAKAVEDATRAERTIKAVVQKGPAPTVKTLGQTVTEGLQGARGSRTAQEILRSQERASRSQAFGKSLQANPTMAGAREASQHLKGEYPKVRFGGFQDFSPEAQDAMVKVIADHPMLRPFEQKRATAAIAKIVDGQTPAKNEEKLLRSVFGHDTTNDMMRSVSKFHQLKALGYDIANIPRSVMASFDASGIMRQGLLIGTGHPVIFGRNIPAYFKAIKSEDFYNAGLEGLHSRPNAVNGVYEKMGVDFTELTPRGDTAAREESFRSPMAEKIPGVRQSGRGFVLYLDAARADLADYMYAKAVKKGVQNDQHVLESIGDVVNSASGRGDLGNGVIGRSQEGLNLLLFSPRLIKSRVDFMNPLWYAKLDPLARHQAYRSVAGLAVLVAAADKIAASLGAKVNLDPRSSDFAKIRMGNTRIDLAGGFQQYMRLLAEVGSQSVVSSTTGQASKLGKEGPGKTSDWDVFFRFLRSKLAPVTSAAVDLSQRENAVGQPLTVRNTLLTRITPLSGQDAFSVGPDAAQSLHSTTAGVLAGLGAFGLSALGGGVQNYKPKRSKVIGYGSRNPYTQGSVYDQTPGGASGSVYDQPSTP
jgi:hypothetical protein